MSQQQPADQGQVPSAYPVSTGFPSHNTVKQVSENSSEKILHHAKKHPLHFNNPGTTFNNYPDEKAMRRRIMHGRMDMAAHEMAEGPITWDTIAEEQDAQLSDEDQVQGSFKGWKMKQLSATTFETVSTPAEKEPTKTRGWIRRRLHI